ncbi:fatty-acid amide hydrolase [Saccharata proteae CBS 121410]|uniref:amidase n=1 Tax=Saccharata proteae CBS 121410 TaxID=1314787 RepID=A0A9P4LVZ4_9PEZI|nr:fatty-acid amide hydrolase [Saccharata proteae CBS 121410]
MAGWEDIAAKKRERLLASIPADWRIPPDVCPPETQLDVTTWPASSGWFSDEELEITGTSAEELLVKLKSKEWSSEKVTKAFCKRAAAAHQLTNCLSETLFDAALEYARSLDAHLASTGQPVGPLHGLPISIKDNFNIVGLDSTLGFTSWVASPAAYNSTLVDLLRAAGAVLYVKTNVPTAMMIAESVNNVFGRTLNPRNRSLTPGGSSGGESALIAFGGSPLGVGSDIGGSLRIPAACTGIFTLRPSLGRFPTLQTKSGLAGQEAVPSVNGPLAPTLEAVRLYSEAVVGQEPWLYDPKCVPMPWRKVEVGKKLRLGVLWDDGVVMPTPPVRRALRETVDKLKGQGHEIIDWSNEDHKQAGDIIQRMFTADGGKTVASILAPTSEPIRPEMQAYASATEAGCYDLWQLHLERTALQKRYLDRWNAAGIDGLLCPTTPYATVAHGKFGYVGYTCVFNILDYAAVSFPSGVVADAERDGGMERGVWYGEVDEKTEREYDAAGVHGMPVSLQLVARRLEEEKVLAMTERVLEAL